MPLALYCCKLLALDAAAMVDAIEIVWIANVAASALPHPVPRDAFHPSRNPVFFFFFFWFGLGFEEGFFIQDLWTKTPRRVLKTSTRESALCERRNKTWKPKKNKEDDEVQHKWSSFDHPIAISLFLVMFLYLSFRSTDVRPAKPPLAWPSNKIFFHLPSPSFSVRCS